MDIYEKIPLYRAVGNVNQPSHCGNQYVLALKIKTRYIV